MDQQLTVWKAQADRFWSALAPDFRAAAQLAAEIAGAGGDDGLRKAAAQALPSLRNAMAKRADRSTRDLAKRRFSVVRDLLHTLTAPRFGKRGGAPAAMTPQEHHRQMLGLPFGRRLSAPGNPRRLQARGENRASRRRRQRARFCETIRRARRADEGEVRVHSLWPGTAV